MAMIIHGIPGSGNTTPIELLCSMAGVKMDMQVLAVWEGKQMEPAFLAINPMHTAPAMVDGETKIWECRAILRYIANKNKLEDFYPTDPAKRAYIDCALDWNMGSMNPVGGSSFSTHLVVRRGDDELSIRFVFLCPVPHHVPSSDPYRVSLPSFAVGTKMSYPWLGYAPHPTADEFKAAEEKWTKELAPSLELFIKKSGGPFVGGAKPSIADFAIIGYLLPTCIILPDGAVAQSKVAKDFIAACKAEIPKFEEIMAAAVGGATGAAEKAKAGAK